MLKLGNIVASALISVFAISAAIGEERAVGGITLLAKSDCAAVPESAMLDKMTEELKNAPYPVIPPNKKGLRFSATLNCQTYDDAAVGTTIYSGEIALDVLAHVAQPFSDNYWMPIYDYKIYGVKGSDEIPASFAEGMGKFLSAMRPVTRQTYLGFGMVPPVD